jgi:hypothetical protein
MSKSKIILILQSIIFLIPINIYIIGDWLGSGIQTMFFRYQQTYMGNGFIFISREMSLVLNSTIYGKSAYASVIWCIGVAIICIATLLLVIAYLKKNPSLVRYTIFLNLGGALLFAIATVIQYGITLNGPAGIAIPIGIPAILGVACLQYRWKPDDQDDGNHVKVDDDADKEPLLS